MRETGRSRKQMVMAGALLFLAALPAWSISHVGTKMVMSERSQFVVELRSPYALGLSTNASHERVQVFVYSSNPFGPTIRPTVLISELDTQLPISKSLTPAEFRRWLSDNGYAERKVQNCVTVMTAGRNGTQTTIAFWGQGRGVHIASLQESYSQSVVDDFLANLRLSDLECNL